MEPDLCVENGSMIRVAVLAVGDMPAAYLRDYLAMVVRHSRVDLTSVSSFYTEHQKSPFAQEPWDTGSLYFKFMVGGAARSPWEDFQAQRKILGVIGLCHCPLSPDIGAAYDQFMGVCRSYPSALAKRCFAFNPSDAQVEQDDKKRQHLIMFPPADRQMLEVHMQTLMQDFAASLLMEFESWVLHAEPVGAILTTPLDSQASLNSEEVSRAKKRRLGRVQKTIGDYCLLAGSPVDANAHYSTAIELARLTSDVFWHAGALEGSISALVLDRSGKRDALLEDEVKLRYAEVIQLYRRLSAVSFELEATLKLARFLARRELAREVADLLMGVVDGSKSLMDASDRLVVNVEVARIYGSVGYERKAAFFARQVAQLYLQQDSRWAAISALQVLLLTSKPFRIQLRSASWKSEDNQRTPRDNKTFNQLTVSGLEGQWSTLQMDVLGDMLSAAVRAGDPLAAWSAAACLLRNHYPLITPSAQSGLATALTTSAERLPAGTRCSDPALPFVRLHSHPARPSHMDIVKRSPGQKNWWSGSRSSGPFIYSPFAGRGGDSRKSEVVWIVGEPVQVLVELANPCAFEVFVDSICLSVGTGEFEAFPISASLPSNTTQILTLSGIPLSVGSLTVRGCFVHCFGVTTEHLFEDVSDILSGAARGLILVDPFRSGGGPRVRPQPNTGIMVMPPLPLLIAQVVGGEGAVVLYEGEIRELQISLGNAGVVPVLEANMSLTGKYREHVLSIGHDALEAALPLQPGATVVVPVTLKAGQPTPDTDNSPGNAWRTPKESTSPMLVIHYAGPAVVPGEYGDSSAELPPGRRLVLPLHLNVLQGLCLVQARLLSMEVPAQISRSLPDPASAAVSKDATEGLVKMDPYRGSWGLRLLELELLNATDVLFEITVGVRQRPDEEKTGNGSDSEVLYPSTRIDRDYSARVLVPLERFKLPVFDKAYLGRTSLRKDGMTKQNANSTSNADRQTKAELTATINELSSRICVKWCSGRNSSGELPMKDAIREALQSSAIEILLPDPLTFGFRLAKSTNSTGKVSETVVRPLHTSGSRKGDMVTLERRMEDFISAREVTKFEILVRNNTKEAVAMTLSVTCRDVAGATCLGSGSKFTVLWAGALNGIDVEVAPLREVVHAFALCFLVPGEYTLLGAAVIHDTVEDIGPEAKFTQPNSSNDPPPLCYSGPPFKVSYMSRALLEPGNILSVVRRYDESRHPFYGYCSHHPG